MNLLALESSTHALSVALWRDGVIRERRRELPNAGSQHLLPWVSELLAEEGMNISAVDGLAFGAGPGGFVGLRLACALAQGLAIGLAVPVLGVCTLEAMAFASGANGVCACLDARMGEVYAGTYRVSADGAETVQAPGIFAPNALTPLPPGAWVGVGDGFDVHGPLLRQRFGDWLCEVRPGVVPTAAAVASLAAIRLRNGASGDAGTAMPFYLRNAVALTTAERLARGGVR